MRFKGGEYPGKTYEEIMLRDAPHLYRTAFNARQSSGFWGKEFLAEFNRLRSKLVQVKVTATCRECSKPARWLTLPVDKEGRYWTAPYYWCDHHEPWEKHGISEKLPIHFDVITKFVDKRSQHDVHVELRQVLGVPQGTRITEAFALEFFK
jgi:hypothetical protein